MHQAQACWAAGAVLGAWIVDGTVVDLLGPAHAGRGENRLRGLADCRGQGLGQDRWPRRGLSSRWAGVAGLTRGFDDDIRAVPLGESYNVGRSIRGSLGLIARRQVQGAELCVAPSWHALTLFNDRGREMRATTA